MPEDKQQDRKWAMRFPLEGAGDDSPPLHDDPRVEFIRTQLAALLDLVVLCKDGQVVQPNGFKMIADLGSSPDWTYSIFPPPGKGGG